MTEQTTLEMTERYTEILESIRAGSDENLKWFAETSMKFGNTLGQLFTDAQRVNQSAIKLINMVVQTVESTPELAEAVIELSIVTGNLTAEDIFDTGEEVLQ